MKTPKPATHHSGPNGPGSASSPSEAGATSDAPAASTGAASTDPFHEHENAPPDPLNGPGGFNPGTPGGKGAIGGTLKVAATPEPGSILLIGTGLLGVLGVLRKRQAL
ncbi:MAG: PEP-CTERM sorting domain-containing protein [Vicinamibacterales bacterium]